MERIRKFLYEEKTLDNFRTLDNNSFKRLKKIIVPYIYKRNEPLKLLCDLMNNAWFVTSLIITDMDMFWADYEFYDNLLPITPIDYNTGYPRYNYVPDRTIVLSLIYYLIDQELELKDSEIVLDLINNKICDFQEIYEKITEIYEDGVLLDKDYFALKKILESDIDKLEWIDFYSMITPKENVRRIVKFMNCNKETKLYFIDRIINHIKSDSCFTLPFA